MELSLKPRCAYFQPQTQAQSGEGNHCTRKETKMLSASCAWAHKALLSAAEKAHERHSKAQTQHLANFFPVHHCLTSWLHTSYLTFHGCSISSLFHVRSALSFGILLVWLKPGLPRLPLYLLGHSLSHTSSFGSFRLAWR